MEKKNLAARFQKWLEDVYKKPVVSCAAELTLSDNAFPGEEFSEDVSGLLTKSGRPEVFTATAEEVSEYLNAPKTAEGGE